MIATTRLMICRMGIGRTAKSKFLVRKSKKNLGQKKASRVAANWSERHVVSRRRLYDIYHSPDGLTNRSSQDDQARPVVLDELAHAISLREVGDMSSYSVATEQKGSVS